MSGSSTFASNRRGGNQPLSRWEGRLGLPEGFSERTGGEESDLYEKAVHWLAEVRPPRQNFWPALSLALISQAEAVLSGLQQDSLADVFQTVAVEQSSARRVRNTLNFEVGGKTITLRPRFNDAADVIRVDMRRDHPSSAPHATQAWPDYSDLISMIYAMSPSSRSRLADYVWHAGVLEASERQWANQAERIVRPFEKTLADFDTSNARPGGALFQSLVFGYFHADSPNLTLESHSVNTGSSRADMPGDVAGFRGGEVELAVEVKDFALTDDRVEQVLVDFLEDLAHAPNATAVVVADEVDQASHDRLATSNVIALSRDELRERVITWDLPKQQEALRGALYYLNRIQKNAGLAARLTTFLTAHDIASGVIDQPIIKPDQSNGSAADSTGTVSDDSAGSA